MKGRTQSDSPPSRASASAGCCASGSGSSCCSPKKQNGGHWVEGIQSTPVGDIPTVKTVLRRRDKLGAAKVRLGVGRLAYAVPPGLFAVGAPGADSPVLVTANYKLSFDALRKELTDVHAWLLVLDTKGINVWCAAGAGTFGTRELVRRVREANLAELVSHRELIVPQLGAPGVSASDVCGETGFKVVYGPVRAQDVPSFLAAGNTADTSMRRVRFDLRERAVVIPVELRSWFVHMVCLAAVFGVMGGLTSNGFAPGLLPSRGGAGVLAVLTGYVAGGIATPLLLPWLPGRYFSVKGVFGSLAVSVAVIAAIAFFYGFSGVSSYSAAGALGWLITSCAVGSFMALNYTGTSTFTSLSGVKKETQRALPVQVAGLTVGMVLWIFSGVA